MKKESCLYFLKRVIHGSKRLFTPIALGFIGYFFWDSKDLFVEIFTNANHLWLIYSAFFWMLLHFSFPVFTCIILKGYSIPLSYKDVVWIHIKRLPAKYIPGGIWHTVARVSDYHQKGIKTHFIAAYLLIENISIATVTLIIGGSIVLFLLNDEALQYIIIFLISFSSLTIISLPLILKANISSFPQSLSTSHYYSAILYLFIYWVIVASSFICFLSSFPNNLLSVTPFTSGGIYIFSWGIGFISLFSPQGIGVSEYISAQLLETKLDKRAFIALLASFRIVIFIADTSTWILLKTLKPFLKFEKNVKQSY